MTSLRAALFYTLGLVPAAAGAIALEVGLISGSAVGTGPLSVLTIWVLRPLVGALLVYFPLAWLVHRRLTPGTRHIGRALPLYITLIAAVAVVMSFIPKTDELWFAIYVAHFPTVTAVGGIAADVIMSKVTSGKARTA